MEKEIVLLRRKFQKENIKHNFDKRTKILNQIINNQRPIHVKSRLGYNQRNPEMGSSSKTTKDDKRSYIDIVKESIKREDCESLKDEAEMKECEEDESARRKFPVTHNNDLRRHTPSRRPAISRYQSFFSSLCYACNNYGHKAIDCRTYTRYINEWGRNRYENSKYQAKENYIRKSQLASRRNYNRFGALNYDIECYRCHNFGHIAKNYRSRLTGPSNLFKERKQPSEYHTN